MIAPVWNGTYCGVATRCAFHRNAHWFSRNWPPSVYTCSTMLTLVLLQLCNQELYFSYSKIKLYIQLYVQCAACLAAWILMLLTGNSTPSLHVSHVPQVLVKFSSCKRERSRTTHLGLFRLGVVSWHDPACLCCTAWGRGGGGPRLIWITKKIWEMIKCTAL